MKVLKNMRYVAFGLVVLLGVVGQAEASGVRKRLTDARTKVVDSGRKFLGLKPKNQNSNVAQNSPAVPSLSMSMQDDGDMDSPVVVDSQPAQAAPSRSIGQRFKAMLPGQTIRDLNAQRRALEAQASNMNLSKPQSNVAMKQQADMLSGKVNDKVNSSRMARFMNSSVVPSYLTKTYMGEDTTDHRFFGNTQNAISDKYNQLKARFKRNQPAAIGGEVESGSAEGPIKGAQTRRFAAAREAFGRAKQALTPSDATKEKAKALLTKLRPDRAMLANEIRGLNSQIKKLKKGNQDDATLLQIAKLEGQLEAARKGQEQVGVLFQESRARLANAKKYLTPESGLLGQVATAWRNRGKGEGQREAPQNPGFFGGRRAKRNAAKDAAAEAAAAEANSGDASAAAAGNDSASSAAVNKSGFNDQVMVNGRWRSKNEEGSRYDSETGTLTFADGAILAGSSAR